MEEQHRRNLSSFEAIYELTKFLVCSYDEKQKGLMKTTGGVGLSN